MLATRFKGNKGGSEECKAQKACFVCWNKNYCRHGNSHNEEGKDFGKSSNSPIIHNAWKINHNTKAHEYLLLQRHEELARLQHWMGTLHTSHNAIWKLEKIRNSKFKNQVLFQAKFEPLRAHKCSTKSLWSTSAYFDFLTLLWIPCRN